MQIRDEQLEHKREEDRHQRGSGAGETNMIWTTVITGYCDPAEEWQNEQFVTISDHFTLILSNTIDDYSEYG